ncbi:MAG: hypothetical protein HXS52_07965 [Theionarchaea archaeon]|nr:hypothetical protein [Theionarchaea archaeon]MBU7037852.1 hypothetical protein [Theionarchaea archaeon]
MSNHPGRELLSQLRKHRYEGRIVSIDHLQNMKEELEEQYKRVSIPDEIYDRHLSRFSFEPPSDLSEAASLIVIAVPQHITQVVFFWNEKRVPVTIPPTYLSVARTTKMISTLLSELSDQEYVFVEASLPEKLVAAHSGLASYGRNNLTYLPQMGSFHIPLVFFSDLPCSDSWQNPQMMEPCKRCSVCMKECPTGAITSEQFLIDAERCLTLHNERPSRIPFPGWIDPSWHNCLVGCIKCQYACPENRKVATKVEEGPVFSRTETTLLLEGVPFEELPSDTALKLTSLEMEDWLDVIPRNLKALLPR